MYINWRKRWEQRGNNEALAATGGRDPAGMERCLDQLLSTMQFQQGDRVLDIGCAKGALFQRIGDVVGLGIGIDLSYSMLPQVKTSSSTHFVQADAVGLPFADGAFTKITATSVLPYLPADALGTFLHECGRVMSQHGLLFLGGMLDRHKAKNLLYFGGFNFPRSLRELTGIFKRKSAFALGLLTTHELPTMLSAAAEAGFAARQVPGVAGDSLYKDDGFHFSLLLERAERPVSESNPQTGTGGVQS